MSVVWNVKLLAVHCGKIRFAVTKFQFQFKSSFIVCLQRQKKKSLKCGNMVSMFFWLRESFVLFFPLANELMKREFPQVTSNPGGGYVPLNTTRSFEANLLANQENWQPGGNSGTQGGWTDAHTGWCHQLRVTTPVPHDERLAASSRKTVGMKQVSWSDAMWKICLQR